MGLQFSVDARWPAWHAKEILVPLSGQWCDLLARVAGTRRDNWSILTACTWVSICCEN